MLPASPSSFDKPALREMALQRRAALTAEQRKGAALKVTDCFMREVHLSQQSVVGGYWPVRGELDVLPLLEILRGQGHDIALPCVTAKKEPLVFRLWDTSRPLVCGAFGIAAPDADSPVVMPDVLLVPLLAFDGRGHRLGYGAGFYDRTLCEIRKERSVRAIGIAYDEQGVDFLPVEETDIPMDMIVTDKAVYRFGTAKE